MIMRKGLLIGVLLITVSGIGRAAETEIKTCARWSSLPLEFKTAFVLGWIEAVNTVESLAKVDANVNQFLWPKGHRVGGVVLEMDIQCKKPANRTKSLADIMAMISYALNQGRTLE